MPEIFAERSFDEIYEMVVWSLADCYFRFIFFVDKREISYSCLYERTWQKSKQSSVYEMLIFLFDSHTEIIDTFANLILDSTLIISIEI